MPRWRPSDPPALGFTQTAGLRWRGKRRPPCSPSR